MKNFIQDGNVVTAIAPSGGVVSGDVSIIGTLVLIAVFSAIAGEEFEGQASHGVFEFTKNTADAPVQGASAYWDDTNKRVTVTASGNTLIGVFMKDYANGDTLAQVRFSAN